MIFLFTNNFVDFDLKEKDKNICMDALLHAADISNPTKPFVVYFQWTEKVLTEFFQQVENFLLFSIFRHFDFFS